MVQTEQQYIYIHHCVLCVLEGREDEDEDGDSGGSARSPSRGVDLHSPASNRGAGGGGYSGPSNRYFEYDRGGGMMHGGGAGAGGGGAAGNASLARGGGAMPPHHQHQAIGAPGAHYYMPPGRGNGRGAGPAGHVGAAENPAFDGQYMRGR